MKNIFPIFIFAIFAVAVNAQQPTVSATGITFKYCIATEGSFSDTINESELPYKKDGFSFPTFGTYTRTIQNKRGCDSIVTYTIVKAPYCFTVSSSGAKVAFAPGNLQYRASQNGTAGDLTHVVRGGGSANGEFRFAEHQWDYVGDNTYGTVYVGSTKCSNSKISSTYTGWIDLFGFGTSGYAYDPYSQSYYSQSSFEKSASEDIRKRDWGYYNTIGTDAPGTWRTLSKSEMEYVFGSRNGYDTLRYAAKVHGVEGLILLPDNWINPGVTLTKTIQNYSYNTITDEQWTSMEEKGAVFIPKSGYRDGTTVNEMPNNSFQGYIWTSTINSNSSSSAWRLYLNTSNSPISVNTGSAAYGRGVRLVKDL